MIHLYKSEVNRSTILINRNCSASAFEKVLTTNEHYHHHHYDHYDNWGKLSLLFPTPPSFLDGLKEILFLGERLNFLNHCNHCMLAVVTFMKSFWTENVWREQKRMRKEVNPSRGNKSNGRVHTV